MTGGREMLLPRMIDTTQSQANQAFTEITASFDDVTASAQEAHVQWQAEQALINHHLSDEGIAGAAMPDRIVFDTTESLDPAYFNTLTTRFVEPSTDDRDRGVLVTEVAQPIRPEGEVERQVDALSPEQQRTVIAEVAAYIVAMRSYKLQTIALQAASSYRQQR